MQDLTPIVALTVLLFLALLIFQILQLNYFG